MGVGCGHAQRLQRFTAFGTFKKRESNGPQTKLPFW